MAVGVEAKEMCAISRLSHLLIYFPLYCILECRGGGKLGQLGRNLCTI